MSTIEIALFIASIIGFLVSIFCAYMLARFAVDNIVDYAVNGGEKRKTRAAFEIMLAALVIANAKWW